ncbi:MAG: type II toxin-antitoxin system HicA family toxin [Gemmataceae bacterium]
MKAVSGKEMCKILERHGWLLQLIRSSHHIYAKDDMPGVIITVPVHRNRSLPTGMQRVIMRAAGLKDDDL